MQYRRKGALTHPEGDEASTPTNGERNAIDHQDSIACCAVLPSTKTKIWKANRNGNLKLSKVVVVFSRCYYHVISNNNNARISLQYMINEQNREMRLQRSHRVEKMQGMPLRVSTIVRHCCVEKSVK
jgi:hypothetical protein